MDPNPPQHKSLQQLSALGLLPPQLALSRRPRLRAHIGNVTSLVHPLPGYMMWRGNHSRYRYSRHMVANWGEGETRFRHHQHFAHAKCVNDYGRGTGREFEFLTVRRGRMMQRALPLPQYMGAAALPPTLQKTLGGGEAAAAAKAPPPSEGVKWLFKSWHSALGTSDMFQREVQYASQTPEHLGAKRPLAVLAPQTLHRQLHLMHMEKITVTVCPLVFGFGATTLQKRALDFYRRALSARSPFPKDKIFLTYTIDAITPRIEVTWLDGTTFCPPLLEGMQSAQDIVQLVMEEGWLAADRMEAAGRVLQPLAIDDYQWQALLTFKKRRDKEAAKAKKPGK